jgi:hypothetical protein
MTLEVGMRVGDGVCAVDMPIRLSNSHDIFIQEGAAIASFYLQKISLNEISVILLVEKTDQSKIA